MSCLDPNLSLLGMTIPGTHDTCRTNPADGTEWTGQRARFGIVPMDFPDFHGNVVEMLIDKDFV